MPSTTEIIEQQKLLALHRQRLAHNLQREAALGTMYTPPGLATDIKAARDEIHRIKLILRSWKIKVEDHPDDLDNNHISSNDTFTPKKSNQHYSIIRNRKWEIRIFGIPIISICENDEKREYIIFSIPIFSVTTKPTRAITIITTFISICLFIILASRSVQISDAANTQQTGDEIERPKKLLEDARRWTQVFNQKFDSTAASWSPKPNYIVTTTLSITDSQPLGSRLLMDSRSLVSLGAIEWAYIPSVVVTDFYAAVDVRREKGASDTSAGIVFRANIQSGRMYVFRILDGGTADFSVFVPGTVSQRLATFRSTAIMPMDKNTNHIEVVVQGSHFVFFVNGSYVGQEYDPHIQTGTVDVIICIPRQEQAIYSFDNLEVRTP